MNTSLKNPCLECGHHLAGGEKNCEQCRKCDKRVEYVNAIGTCPGESVNVGVSLEGGSGSTLESGGYVDDGRLDLLNTSVEDLSGPKSKEDLATEKEIPECDKADLIERHIKDICLHHGTTIDQIRAGVKRSEDKTVRNKFHQVRNHIIEFLSSGQVGKFTQGEIGNLLNVSGATICALIKDYRIPTPTQTRKKKKLFKSPAGEKPPEIMKDEKAPEAPAMENPSETSAVKPLTLTFDKYPDVYHDIVKMAEEELRNPENQVLWMLVKLHERGLAIPGT